MRFTGCPGLTRPSTWRKLSMRPGPFLLPSRSMGSRHSVYRYATPLAETTHLIGGI